MNDLADNISPSPFVEKKWMRAMTIKPAAAAERDPMISQSLKPAPGFRRSYKRKEESGGSVNRTAAQIPIITKTEKRSVPLDVSARTALLSGSVTNR